jgi:signal peptidase I
MEPATDVSDNPTPAATADAEHAAPAKSREGSFAWFLFKLFLAVLFFRTFVFGMFSIPSESMLPGLMVGDYLFTEKWAYGYSQASMPRDIKLFPGRIFDHEPSRGDVVVFKHPIDRTDYIKRVIGLPGDTIQMKGGVLYINGEEVSKVRVSDFVAPITPYNACRITQFRETEPDGTRVCRYPRYRETMPNGVSYEVLDFGQTPQDDTAPVIVPEGRLFMMGDNRDNSEDSRFPAVAGGAVGMVPEVNVVGRAAFIAFSTDGDASWLNPVSWFRAARWNRIGDTM